jgi:hypothetical protein
MRRILFSIITGVLTGGLILGVGWATTGLIPVDEHARDNAGRAKVRKEGPQGEELPAGRQANAAEFSGQRLPEGQFLVGASRVSIAPVPVSEGGQWNPHGDGYDCGQPEQEYTPFSDPTCLRTFDRLWATGVDDLGIYVRAFAVSNGEKTVAFAVMDTIGWFYGYPADICGDCGSKDIGRKIEELTDGEVPAGGVVVSGTHTHASVDTIAKTPTWYYEQVRDATIQAITEAVANKEPARLETGSTPAKPFNVDRRIVTRAVPDYELGWLRAVPLHGAPNDTIATMVNFAAHPTVTASNAELHSGFVGHLAQRLEDHWGGVTVFMPSGLGDQTVNRSFGRDGIGYGLADLVIRSQDASAYTLGSNEIEIDRSEIQIPNENQFLLGANKAGLFVRDSSVPGEYAAAGGNSVQSKSGISKPTCVGAAPLSVVAPIGGIRIGTPGLPKERAEDGTWRVPPGDPGDSIVIMQAPGEAFSSISAITKDYLSRSRNVFLIGLANDMLGYLIPYEQYDHTAGQGVGLVHNATDTGNYEESLNLGRCTGDQVQNALLETGARLGVMGDGEGR